jgi:hypothetical protein
MSRAPDQLLAMRYGDASVSENLRRAVDAGTVIENDDGTLSVAPRPHETNWAVVPNGPTMDCTFLIRFLFPAAYGGKAVPHGCQACYKVKVALRTMRELVAAWGIAKRIACYSKWGVDLDNPFSQDIYAGYFYTSGLDAAHALFRVMREAVDSDPKLGSEVRMSIKRGCSTYEAALGPSDKYQFAPEQAELESWLRTRYRESRKPQGLPAVPLAHWIDVAFRIGDDTYLDFTGGRRPRPKLVDYAPGSRGDPDGS